MKHDGKSLYICPICRGNEVKSIYHFDEFFVMKCISCDTSWRSNIYTKDQIQKIYNSEEYAKASYFSYDQYDIEKLEKNKYKNYLRAVKYAESLIGIGSVLDVGCGSGAFITLVKERGWEVEGIEISDSLCAACRRNTNVVIHNSSFEEVNLPENNYDLITFWDVIEHVIDPLFLIDKAKKMLRPGGLALFCTPNERSLITTFGWILYKFTGSYYSYPAFALHPPTHIFYFSKKGFLKLLQSRGMKIIKSYSQQMHFEDSMAATKMQKRVIAFIEQMGRLIDCCWDLVVLAKL